MTTLQDTITARTLTAVKTVQDLAVDASKTVADAVTPYLPAFRSLPFTDKFPQPAEVVEKAFDVTTVLLAGLRNVAVEATKAWTKPAAQPAATAPKTMTTKPMTPKNTMKTRVKASA